MTHFILHSLIEKTLAAVQQNAEEGTVTKEDLEKVKDVLEENISFSLFGN